MLFRSQAQFEYRIEGGAAAPTEEFRTRAFAEAAGGRKELPVSERFAVLDLDLAVGQKLILKVTARDGDTLTGPHLSSSPTYTFQIVSDDELIALVAVKELNIRRRFEQILEEVRNTRKDLLLNRTRMEEARPLRAKPQETRTREEAERLADHINIVDHGRLIASGTPLELTRGGSSATIRLVVTRPFPPGAPESLRAALGPDIDVTALDELSLVVTGPADASTLGKVSGWCEEQGVLPESLTLGQRTLEDVFLELTGRELTP